MFFELVQIACEAWIKKGDPKEVLCSEVKRVRPDLLVVGSRGLGPFQRYYLGVNEFIYLLITYISCEPFHIIANPLASL